MSYATPLKYFFVMVLLLLASGVWMFVLHTSLSVQGIIDYYAPKTFFGLLEIVSPHLFAMGLLVFTLTHFFALIQGVKQEKYRQFTFLLFLFMLLSNLSGFFIEAGGSVFSLVKLLSTLVFVFYSIWAMFKLYKLF